jgi:metacaspase-1
MRTRAVLMGLNYIGHRQGQLRGCANDVANMKTFLVDSLGFRPEDVQTITDVDGGDVTRDGILDALHGIVVDTWARDLDVAWIHYSGHGTSDEDLSGDERDGRDECLVPVDYQKSGLIRDDLINKILMRANPKTRIVCIFDCCHSGTIVDLPYRLCGDVVTVEGEPVAGGPRIVALSGCTDAQTSADAHNVLGKGTFTGAMTSCLLTALGEKKDFLEDLPELLKRLRDLLRAKGFSQVPQLTSTHDLRQDPFRINFD